VSIRAGQILHAANRRGYVIDRIQTGGPGDLNIPTEKVNELGNFRSVATIRDAPDLSFSLDMLNVGCEVERILTNRFGAEDFGPFEFDQAIPLDIISPWKSGMGDFGAVHGVAIPNLYLESVSYAFGLDDNAGQTFTLAGDSIFYCPGTPELMEATGNGTETDFDFMRVPEQGATPVAATALLYVESGISQYALSVSVNGERQNPDSGTVADPNMDGDYTQDANGVYFHVAPATGALIRIVFAHGSESNWEGVHEGVAVKPAAIRGRDIVVKAGHFDPENVPENPDDYVLFRWGDVQSVGLDWSVTLEEDMEFGNPRAVARDFTDVPEVSGNIEIKPISIASLFEKLRRITGVPDGQVIGPASSVVIPLEIELRNPDSGGTTARVSGEVIKTFYVPDARFTLPGYEGAVETKMTNTLNFESDEGVLQVFDGPRVRPAANPTP
jgi:hypothetical protein